MLLNQITGYETRAELCEAISNLRATKARCLRTQDFRDAIDADVDDMLELIRDMDTRKRLATRARNQGASA